MGNPPSNLLKNKAQIKILENSLNKEVIKITKQRLNKQIRIRIKSTNNWLISIQNTQINLQNITKTYKVTMNCVGNK